MDDLFLKIIAGVIPSARIYEDELVVAFLDIRPNNKGHALVVPRERFRNILDGNPDILAHMMKVAQKIAVAQKAALSCDGINLVMNNESAAGQEIFHAHLHVIPRYTGDGVFGSHTHTEFAQGEIETFAEKIKNSIR